MAVTAHRAVTRLLRYFSDDEQVLPPPAQFADRWQICAEAINSAFSEAALALGNSYQSMRERGWMFDAPAAVTVAVTKGSRAATITSATPLVGGNVTGRLLSIGGKDYRIHWQSAYANPTGTPGSPAVPASLTTAISGANNDLVITANTAGAAGNNIEIGITVDNSYFEAISVTAVGTEISAIAAGKIAMSIDGITADANGDPVSGTLVYTHTGIFVEAKPTFLQATDSILFNGDAEWQIRVNGGIAFKSSDNVATPDLVTTWVAQGLAAGTPSITALAHTSAQLKTAIEANPAADALVTVTNAPGNDGTGSIATLAQTNLSGGTDAIPDAPAYYTHTVELVDEYTGETGTVSATIHCDARVLEADILSVDSVSNDSGLPLDPVGSDAGALRIMGGPTRDFGFERRRNVRRYASTVRMSSLAGQLAQCYSIRQPKPDSSATKILTIYPPPSAATTFRGRILTGPFALDIPTLAAAGNLVTALQAITIPVHDTFFDDVIFPIAAQNLTGSTNFRNDSAVEQISRKYQAALLELEKLRAQGTGRIILMPS